MTHFVYILANKPHGAIYVGSARDLRHRAEQHKSGAVPGHTKKYNIKTLVWFEVNETLEAALLREKQIKRWRRVWKDELVEENNPHWNDISSEIPL